MTCSSLQWFIRRIFPIASVTVFCCAAGAQSPRFVLNWQAPPGCPPGAEVAREVDELIASAAPSMGNFTIAANATIATDHGGFTLTLTVRDAEGSHDRRLDAPACEELGHAAALIVALAIDPALLANHADPGGSPTNTVQPLPSVELSSNPFANTVPHPIPIAAQAIHPATASVEPNPATAPALYWRLGLSAFASYSPLPGAKLGSGLFGAIQGRRARLEVAVTRLTWENSADDTRGAAAFVLYRLAPRFCWLVTKPTWAAGPCAGIELGLVSGQGYGVDVKREQTAPWFESSLGALFEWRLGASSLLGLFADAEVPVKPVEFDLAGEKLSKPEVAARFGISLAAGWR